MMEKTGRGGAEREEERKREERTRREVRNKKKHVFPFIHIHMYVQANHLSKFKQSISHDINTMPSLNTMPSSALLLASYSQVCSA